MAQPQHSWVLRCCNCRLFQAHQVKKSLKWTCKACGEKQSFLRAYGEGSGADCRRHVQKLNLLQGQVSELSLRRHVFVASPDPVPFLVMRGKCQRSENRWLKYLDVGYPGPGPGGGEGLHTQPIPDLEQPGPPYIQGLPGKRKWNQSSAQPPHGLDVQDLDGAATTLETQELPQATPIPGPTRPCEKVPGQPGPRETPLAEAGPWVQGTQKAPAMQLCHLFSTGEDFDDDLN
ncbi:MRN complex-interacting protein [Ctenodactylus gundi]